MPPMRQLEPVPGFEVRRVQPFQAVKRYICGGFVNAIEAGTGHVAAVPIDSPDLRRHWHWSCWQARDRRRPVG